MLAAGGEEDEEGNYCPELEWQAALGLLSESLALHCRTKSTAEIMAFMRDKQAPSDKRAATERETERLAAELAAAAKELT